jgi:hypothetical protein
VPAEEGLSLVLYTGSDRNQLSVNGELNKLAHNVTFGHGIQVSMVRGEATTIGFLQGQAETFNEKFTVLCTKLDGSIASISDQ